MKPKKWLNNWGIPVFIVYVCLHSSLSRQNLTYIANQLNHRILVFILSLMIAYNIYTYFNDFIKRLSFPPLFSLKLLQLFAFLLPLAVIVPYNKNDTLFSTLHVWISFGGSVLFLLFLNGFIWTLSKFNIQLYQHILPYYLFMMSGCFTLFIWFGSINSLVEIFFIWMINTLIYQIKQQLLILV